MEKNELSVELMRQTALAWEFLDGAKSIITYMKLVPVRAEQIVEYEKASGKVVPTDYRHWLETHGSGRIEFIAGELEIPSIYEFFEDDGRLVYSDDPANCWKLIYLGCGGAPVTIALDSSIIDEFGCAPVILTKEYSNEVGEVLASSWPMYVILKIMEAAKGLTAAQLGGANSLIEKNFDEIDVHLIGAVKRADEHNNTRLEDDDAPSNLECVHSISRFIKSIVKETDSAWANLAKFDEALHPKDQFHQALITLEKKISLGYSHLGFAVGQDLGEEADPRHQNALRDLLEHPRREMRDIAEEGLQKISDIAPQEDKEMTESSLKYFEVAKELNLEFEKELKAKKLHFRGSIGSFSLISLDRKTPEQGKGGFITKEQGKKFFNGKIDFLLASKKEKIDAGRSRSTREKELQAWIIDYAINHEHRLPFSNGLIFLTSELAFNDSGKIVNDILALDPEGCLVVIELKSSRHKKALVVQVENFCRLIDSKQDFFRELVELLSPGKAWNGRVRKMIVWPDANGIPRKDWNGEIEEVRYKEKPGPHGPAIDYNETGEIVFLW